MTTQETVRVSAALVLTTERGEAPRPDAIARLITDQMSGVLDEDTGLTCAGVDVQAVSGDLESKVHVTVIEHRHGVNTYVNWTEEGAHAALLGFVAEWWNGDRMDRPLDTETGTRPAEAWDVESTRFTEAELIEIYFDDASNERYTSGATEIEP